MRSNLSPGEAEADARPIAFLVSTTRCAPAIRENLGSASYSYYFVMEALGPVLGAIGTWRTVDPPESRLAFAARRARAEGFRPIHLAIQAPQDAYYSPECPTILLPFWEFPDLPDRDFDRDTRHDWRRSTRAASLILAACRFTADAFRVPGIGPPVAVVPVPVAPEAFEMPPWEPGRAWSTTCRHEVWGGDPADPAAPEPSEAPRARGRLGSMARSGFRRIEPYIRAEWVGPIVRVKRRAASLRGTSPARLAYLGARRAYKSAIRPWLGDESVARVTAWKERALRRLGWSPREVVDPLIPSTRLTLSGLVFASFLNVGDARKNYMDLISAFVLAFRDRPDATLVVKVATSPHREFHELGVIRDRYRSLGIDHRCRVVVVTDFLDDDQMAGLARATTYYANTSHAEGACLPLMRALAAGRPAIAPAHTAMADYMDDSVGFVVRSHPEPTRFPHDPGGRLATTRHRLVWSDIRDAFVAADEVTRRDRPRYDAMAAAARDRMRRLAGRPAVEAALREALTLVDDAEPGAASAAS